MKNAQKIMYGMLLMSIIFSMINVDTVVAVGNAPADITEVAGDAHQVRVNASNRVQFRFRQRTRLTFNSNVNIDVNLNCDAMNIGEKDFEIQVIGTSDLNMTMVCTEEQNELGLTIGNTTQVRARNRHRFLLGFVFQIQSNDSCTARLMLGVTPENQGAVFAYYNTTTSEWVAVATTYQDGYLVAETTHFSTWTLLTPELDWILIIGIGAGVAVIIGITIAIIKKKRD